MLRPFHIEMATLGVHQDLCDLVDLSAAKTPLACWDLVTMSAATSQFICAQAQPHPHTRSFEVEHFYRVANRGLPLPISSRAAELRDQDFFRDMPFDCVGYARGHQPSVTLRHARDRRRLQRDSVHAGDLGQQIAQVFSDAAIRRPA